MSYKLSFTAEDLEKVFAKQNLDIIPNVTINGSGYLVATVDFPIGNGSELRFKAPAHCSQISGLIVNFKHVDGSTASREFLFTDAHGNDVGKLDQLFEENTLISVVLDAEHCKAFILNGDTNTYIEHRFDEIEEDVAELKNEVSETYINVASLPLSGISEKIAYRVLEGTFVGQKRFRYDATCYTVDWENGPTGTGTDALTKNDSGFNYVGYYNIKDNQVYAYVGSSTTTLLTGLVASSDLGFLDKLKAEGDILALTGWRTFNELITKVTELTSNSISWGGVVYTLEDIIDENALYVFVGAKTYYRNNGVWTSNDFTIGRRGTDSDAEVFNDLNNVASAPYAHAEGSLTTASGAYSHAEGYRTEASGLGAHSEGQDTHATGPNAHAEGQETIASGNYTHAEGFKSVATNWYAHAEGVETEATATGSHAEGGQTNAFGQYSHAEGQATTASGDYSHAEGRATTASNSYAHAEGEATIAEGIGAHAEGLGTQAVGGYSHAEGKYSKATKDVSHAEGYNTKASYYYSHAEGANTISSGEASHAEGLNTEATKQASHAEGVSAAAAGVAAHAEGSNTVASGRNAHAEGEGAKATGTNTHAEGYNTSAEAWGAHAEGGDSHALGQYAHAEGLMTHAAGEGAHSEGRSTKAIGNASHAEGRNCIAGRKKFNVTRVTGSILRQDTTLVLDSVEGISVGDELILHVINPNPTVLGECNLSFTVSSINENYLYITTWISGLMDDIYYMGQNNYDISSHNMYVYSNTKPELGTTIMSGNNSHAGGLGTKALLDNQTVIGQYNDNDNALFIVGCGDDDTRRRNAFAVSRTGFATVANVDSSNPNSVVNVNYLTSQNFAYADTVSMLRSNLDFVAGRLDSLAQNSQSNPWLQDVTGCYYRVIDSNGTKEWLNPPMNQLYQSPLNGVYRTSERYFGQPVYTCIVCTGAGANKSKSTTPYEFDKDGYWSGCNVIRCEGFAVDKSNGRRQMIPQRYSSSDYWAIYASTGTDGAISINENSSNDRSAYTVYVQLWIASGNVVFPDATTTA